MHRDKTAFNYPYFYLCLESADEIRIKFQMSLSFPEVEKVKDHKQVEGSSSFLPVTAVNLNKTVTATIARIYKEG